MKLRRRLTVWYIYTYCTVTQARRPPPRTGWSTPCPTQSQVSLFIITRLRTVWTASCSRALSTLLSTPRRAPGTAPARAGRGGGAAPGPAWPPPRPRPSPAAPSACPRPRPRRGWRPPGPGRSQQSSGGRGSVRRRLRGYHSVRYLDITSARLPAPRSTAAPHCAHTTRLRSRSVVAPSMSEVHQSSAHAAHAHWNL